MCFCLVCVAIAGLDLHMLPVCYSSLLFDSVCVSLFPLVCFRSWLRAVLVLRRSLADNHGVHFNCDLDGLASIAPLQGLVLNYHPSCLARPLL